MLMRARFPFPPFSPCGFPADGLAMILVTWLHSIRAADSARESLQTLPGKPLGHTVISLPGAQVRPRPFRRELILPVAQDRIQCHLTDIGADFKTVERSGPWRAPCA